MMGAKPVSSSRTTTLATIATMTKIENTLMQRQRLQDRERRVACARCRRLPIWIVVAGRRDRTSAGRRSAQPTQNTGLLSW